VAFFDAKMLPWPALQFPCWQLLMMVLIPLPMVSARPGRTTCVDEQTQLQRVPDGEARVTPRPKLVATDVPITRADSPLIPEIDQLVDGQTR
jgi:hypothetical protein